MSVFTESEAMGKWCPFARVSLYQSVLGTATASTQNRYFNGTPDGACLCIGSRCMAWKWLDEKHAEFSAGGKGFCGLVTGPGA